MKKFILIAVLIVTCKSFSFAAENPVTNIEPCCPIVFESEAIELKYDVEKYSKYLTPAYFNEETNSLHFEAFSDIKFVQVFSESGKMEYQLPVMSSKFRMNKNMFSKGEYKLTFLFENNTETLETYVKIN